MATHPAPSERARGLVRGDAGFTDEEIHTMTVANTRRLAGEDDK